MNTEQAPSNITTTQEEVSIMRGMFEKFANTVVQASELSADLEALRNQLHNLKLDVETYRERIAELDTELMYVRQARDKAHADLNDVTAQRDRVVEERDEFYRRYDAAKAENESLEKQLSQARKDRDGASYLNLELTEALEKANAKLAKFKALITEDEPIPTVIVAEAPKPSRVYQSDPNFSWDRSHWDDSRGEYYNEVAA